MITLAIQFFAQNLHFAINLLTALVMLMIGLLYFDSWLNKKQSKELYRWIGFLLLVVTYLLNATVLEKTFFSEGIISRYSEVVANFTHFFGYVLIAISLLLDPLQAIPKTEGLKLSETPTSTPTEKSAGAVLIVNPTTLLLVPLGSLTIAVLYWRRATTGLERHLKPVALGFLTLAVSDLLSLSTLFQNSTNVTFYKLSVAFGPLWLLSQLFLLLAIIFLGRWVWRYLITRLQSQLFMISTSMIAIIFLLVATGFTFLMLRNVTSETLNNLSTSTKVLNFALESKKTETLALTEALSTNPEIIDAVASGDYQRLTDLTNQFLAERKQSSLIFTDADGRVIFRAEDPDRRGDSISEDTMIRRAAVGLDGSTITTRQGTLAPQVYLRATEPVKKESVIIGTVSVGLIIGDEFVDGIKKATGLETTVFTGNVRSATTFISADGKSRLIGVKEENGQVKDQVLRLGQEFRGNTTVSNTQYLAVFTPLKDADNVTIGMLMAGKPEAELLQTAGRTIAQSFVLIVALLAISIIPSYKIARIISHQVG